MIRVHNLRSKLPNIGLEVGSTPLNRIPQVADRMNRLGYMGHSENVADAYDSRCYAKQKSLTVFVSGLLYTRQKTLRQGKTDRKFGSRASAVVGNASPEGTGRKIATR
jgi:hypothetical protein